jgi:high affinity Mn2+ porin
MKGLCKIVNGAGIVLATCSVAIAADLPVKAPVPYVSTAYDWNGWYVGAHAGVIRGASNWSATPPGVVDPALNGSFNLPFNFDFMAGTGSYFLGLQGGYNYVAPSRLMLGFEADASAPNSDVLIPYAVRGSQTINLALNGQVTYGEAVMHYGSVRARVGYAFDHFLLYGTAGLAWTYDSVTRTQVAGNSFNGFATPGTVDTKLLWRLGWAAGVGVEIPIAGNWTARAEYLSTGFGSKSMTFPAAAEAFESDLAMQSIRLGVNYRIGGDRHIPDFVTQGPSALETDRFALHAQATYVNQYCMPLRFRLPTAAGTVSPRTPAARPQTSLCSPASGSGKAPKPGSIRKSIRASA